MTDLNRPRRSDGCARTIVAIALTPLFAATVPVSGQCEIAQLLDPDAAPDGRYGRAIAIDGDTAVIGAGAYFDAREGGPGAAYVLERVPGTDEWTAIAALAADDGADGDNFGYAVAIDGDSIVVGAYTEDTVAPNAGAAYVFNRDQDGPDAWGQVAKLTASDGSAHDWFGHAVGLSGDTVIVGAYLADVPTDREGAAYIYERDEDGPGAWGEVTKLGAPDADVLDTFGFAVAIEGDTVLVGAIGDSESCGGGECGAGAAYVFGRDEGGPGSWGVVRKIMALDGDAQDLFGVSVALDGDTALIGAVWDDAAGADAGAASVFGRDTDGVDQWGHVATLTADDASDGDQFGWSLALDGATALVGRFFYFDFEENPCTDPGAVYVFGRDQGGPDAWGQRTKLEAADGATNDQFGKAIALGTGAILIGAPTDDNTETDAGAVYAFTLDGCDDDCPGDLDGSGAVDFGDLLEVLANWGDCPK